MILTKLAVEGNLIAAEANGFDRVTLTPAERKFGELIASRCASIVSLYRRDNMQDKAIADTLEHVYSEIRQTFGLKL